jgi:hypothetical protein
VGLSLKLNVNGFSRRQALVCASALLLLMSLLSLSTSAEIYLTSQQFVDNTFGVNVAEADTFWITKDIATQSEKILGHSPKQLRIKFWKNGLKRLWILDEIGKEEPITAGVLVESGSLVQVTILAYRESRGGEVRHPGFLKQYQGANLQPDYQLNKNIDGISGATLSVRAIGRMAKLALYYDSLSRQ